MFPISREWTGDQRRRTVKSRSLITPTWLSVGGLAVLLAAALAVRPPVVLESPLVLTGLNLVFGTVVPLLAAAFAVSAYQRTGVGAVLAIGAGMVAIGTGSGVLAAILLPTHGANVALTVHNTSLLVAAVYNLAAAFGGVLGISLGRHRLRHVIVAYGGVAIAVAILTVVAISGRTAPFWVPATGSTTTRQLVLGFAVLAFALTGVTWWQTAVRDRGIRFLDWYVPGITLLALAGVAITTLATVGDLVTWIGRVAQYTGTLYLCIAVAAEALPRRAAADPSLALAIMQAAIPFRPLVGSASEGVIAIGADGRVLYCNEAAAKIVGVAAADAVGADARELLASRGVAGPDLDRIFDPSGGPRQIAFEGRTPTTVEARSFAGDGRLVICVLTDISERVRRRGELEAAVTARTAELEQANADLAAANEDLARTNAQLADANAGLARASAAKDEFLGLVSHELKTPITTITAAGQLLERRLAEHDGDGLFRDLAAETGRLSRIVDNLLALARVDPRRRSDREPVMLSPIVAGAVDEMRRQWPDRRLDVSLEPGCIVEASDSELAMVVRNLVSNALKYSPREAPVSVVLVRHGTDAEVSVIDGGPGIEATETARLFEPFYRSDRTQSVAGVGIGLTVCERIVTDLGGTIDAWPREDVTGSVFRFSLPLLSEPDDEEAPGAPKAQSSPAG